MSAGIPFFQLALGKEEKDAVLEVLESNWLTMGPKISEFEKLFAESLQVPEIRAVALSNCTVALHLAILAVGVKKDDEVICPSLTFVACANAIRYVGAIPVFADISSEEDWNLNPHDIKKKITSKTSAILVVHYGGYPCRMEEIRAIAAEYRLKIIEDVSHAHLSEYKGKKLGTIGDVGCFSFFSNKNMTTGEGGMLVSKNNDLIQQVQNMRSHGMTSSSLDRFKGHAFNYDVTVLGYNYRMDEIRAALGIVQLKKLESYNFQRQKLVERYRDLISKEIPQLKVPFSACNDKVSYHIFPILLPDGYRNREQLMKKLFEKGIQTSIHYRPIHKFQAYQSFPCDVPITEGIAERILTLPLYPSLRQDQLSMVVSSLKEFL